MILSYFTKFKPTMDYVWTAKFLVDDYDDETKQALLYMKLINYPLIIMKFDLTMTLHEKS